MGLALRRSDVGLAEGLLDLGLLVAGLEARLLLPDLDLRRPVKVTITFVTFIESKPLFIVEHKKAYISRIKLFLPC